MNQEKSFVVVSRLWDNPNIVISVKSEGIYIEMGMTDFINAVVAEIGNPAAILTQGQLRNKLLNASVAVTSGMKLETEQVM